MHSLARFGTDAEGRAVLVGAGTQMRNCAQKFIRMAFFLQRESFGISQAENSNALCPDFPQLPLAGRSHKFARNADGGARGGLIKLRVGGGARVNNALHIAEAGAVVELHKRKFLGIAAGADPAADGDGGLRFGRGEGVYDKGSLHGMFLVMRQFADTVALSASQLKMAHAVKALCWSHLALKDPHKPCTRKKQGNARKAQWRNRVLGKAHEGIMVKQHGGHQLARQHDGGHGGSPQPGGKKDGATHKNCAKHTTCPHPPRNSGKLRNGRPCVPCRQAVYPQRQRAHGK